MIDFWPCRYHLLKQNCWTGNSRFNLVEKILEWTANYTSQKGRSAVQPTKAISVDDPNNLGQISQYSRHLRRDQWVIQLTRRFEEKEILQFTIAVTGWKFRYAFIHPNISNGEFCLSVHIAVLSLVCRITDWSCFRWPAHWLILP